MQISLQRTFINSTCALLSLSKKKKNSEIKNCSLVWFNFLGSQKSKLVLKTLLIELKPNLLSMYAEYITRNSALWGFLILEWAIYMLKNVSYKCIRKNFMIYKYIRGAIKNNGQLNAMDYYNNEYLYYRNFIKINKYTFHSDLI